MSSEHLASAQNQLKGNLAGAWDILSGAQGQSERLGIARRFGGSAAAYSLRDIGAVNGRVVKVRRDGDDAEEDFSANQVQSSALENWVNGKLENALPADVATAAAAYSLRKVKASYASNAVRIRRSSDDAEVNVAFDSDDKVSASSDISVVSGTVNETTLGGFINGTDAFVHTWYDQAGSNNAVEATAANQPKIASSGALLSGINFDGDTFLNIGADLMNGTDGTTFMVASNIDIDQETFYLSNRDGGTGFHFKNDTSNKGKLSYNFIGSNAQISTDAVVTDSSDNKQLFGFIKDSNDTELFNNSVQLADGTASQTYSASSGSNTSIGKQGNSSSTGASKTLVVYEIISYDSDQTNNRFKIESNINNYYGLYTTSGNGFVSIWYDQSTSGNNAVQATAGNQPSIVQSGGICKSNGSPSVLFTGDTRDDELDFTDLTLTDAAIFTVVNIDSSADQQIILGGSESTSTSTMMPMMDNGSSSTQVYKNSTVGGAEQGSSQFKNGSALTLADRDDAFDNLAVDSQILFTMIDVDVAEAKVLDGISRCPSNAVTFHLQGHMNELIIYNSDQSSDRGDIELEIANYYSITLS